MPPPHIIDGVPVEFLQRIKIHVIEFVDVET
jgi:hypothetical protein